ncbi:MAG: hypothetical protein MJY67_07290 [Bacteroidales bacterium]|nr:hypothetical protein [Bacteroidales bacterium]
MAYDIKLNLPEGWKVFDEVYEEEGVGEVRHLEAHLPNEKAQRDDAMCDIYVGAMPEGETAEDQALANYADTVGFDDDDPEDFNPILKLKFNGKNAYGFQAFCEDDSPMFFLAQEARQGVLCIIVLAAPDDEKLEEVVRVIEKSLRISVPILKK